MAKHNAGRWLEKSKTPEKYSRTFRLVSKPPNFPNPTEARASKCWIPKLELGNQRISGKGPTSQTENPPNPFLTALATHPTPTWQNQSWPHVKPQYVAR